MYFIGCQLFFAFFLDFFWGEGNSVIFLCCAMFYQAPLAKRMTGELGAFLRLIDTFLQISIAKYPIDGQE